MRRRRGGGRNPSTLLFTPSCAHKGLLRFIAKRAYVFDLPSAEAGRFQLVQHGHNLGIFGSVLRAPEFEELRFSLVHFFCDRKFDGCRRRRPPSVGVGADGTRRNMNFRARQHLETPLRCHL